MKFSIYHSTQFQEEMAPCHKVESVEEPIVEIQLSPILAFSTDGNLKLPRMDGPKPGQKKKLQDPSKKKA